MNETSDEAQKTTVIKTLAIIGFIVALIFVAWLAVQAVRLIPVAFNTLASIADGLRNDKETAFTIATGTNIINIGETLTISWTKPAEEGEYVFSYQCTEGVSAEMRNSAGELISVACDTEMPLAEDDNTVAVIFSSEKSRFVDVSYTIGLIGGEGEIADERDGIITIVNPEISANGVASSDNNVATSTTTDSEAEEPPTPAASVASSTEPILYRTVPTVVTMYPVSNPSGYADLAVTFIGVGTYNTSTKTFTAKSSLDEDERGALRFEVKNIGTKTSGTWYFIAGLPTDPKFTYHSPATAALKPNERQVITLQFDNVSKDSDKRITVAVTGGNDAKTANNSFTKRIEIRD